MTLWLAPAPLVLASQSAARRAMLEAAGIAVEVRVAVLDERAVERTAAPGADARAIAALLAREKARRVAAELPDRLVVGADQTLALAGRRFTKPADRPAAREQLLALAGRTHELCSAVAVVRGSALLYEHVDAARLTMRRFSARFLELYLETTGAAVTTSVGGYQLESIGVQLFDRIEGDHFTILGLPLLALLAYLRAGGYIEA